MITVSLPQSCIWDKPDRESPWGTCETISEDLVLWLDSYLEEEEWDYEFTLKGIDVLIARPDIAVLCKLVWGGDV